MSSTRARRQEARKCCQPGCLNHSIPIVFFSISALLHHCTKAWIIPKPFISYWFFQYFCSPALGHEGRKSMKVIHFLFCLVFLLLAQGFWDLDIGLWIFGFWTPNFGFRMLNFRFSTLTFGFWILDFGFWHSDQGFRIAQSPKSKDFGLCGNLDLNSKNQSPESNIQNSKLKVQIKVENLKFNILNPKSGVTQSP